MYENEPEFLWVVLNDSRHISNRFSYLEPTEKLGDKTEALDPWGSPGKIVKINKYKLIETIEGK